MGELVVSSEELEELRLEEEGENKNKEVVGVEEENGEGEGSALNRNSNGLMRWEGLLPRMVLRVLLVEADDSTRQIIAALLRKCSYRVAAVADGLKAWEFLRGRPHNIDLILTEVDLPSISGYALLTLIMEHEICKNIPVIMMSSEDSVSTVYKCMLRGAADYLVKPIRRNELRNLWQHVWRKQSSLVRGNGPTDGSSGQDKAEGTSENNAASNHASGDNACIQRSKENMEKGSDAQSSCTKPDMEAESVHVENVQNLLQPLRKNLPSDKEIRKMNENTSQHFCMHENEAGGPVMIDQNVEAENQRSENANSPRVCNNNEILVASCREAIDFMGASSYYDSCSNNVKGRLERSSHLDLSLRGSHPSSFDIRVTEERNTLRHSSASAFTRYTSKAIQPLTLASSVNQVEPGGNSDGRTSTHLGVHIFSTRSQAPSTRRSIISLANDQTKESEPTTCPEQRVVPIQVPMEGVTFNNMCAGYGSVFPPIFCKQSGSSPTPSPGLASQRESAPNDTPYHHSNFESNLAYLRHRPSQNINDSMNQNLHNEDQEGDNGRISPTTDQSTNSSFCNAAPSRLNSVCWGSTSGSNSNQDQVAAVAVDTENRNEEKILPHNLNYHRSMQREAALNKFRLKRKDRCFEKKVRYESRKKLAEQRPRVKGQFVRQVQVDPPPADAK